MIKIFAVLTFLAAIVISRQFEPSLDNHPVVVDASFTRARQAIEHDTITPTPIPPPIEALVPETPTPEPIPEPTVAPTPEPYVPAGALEQLICSYPWPCEQAIYVASCESGVDANGLLDGIFAVSWTGTSYGLFQLNYIHANKWPDFWENWMNPEWNVSKAYEMWSTSGWGPWDCW